MEKPYAPACDRNRDPILGILRTQLADRRAVLEIGSGTGQHAVYFAQALAHLTWQTSERAQALPGLHLWLDEAGLPNTPPPLALDVSGPWPLPSQRFDAVFTANTLHIMAWPEVQAMFRALPAVMTPGARVVVYGPFNEGGCYTSESNQRFDASLKASAQHQGLRDLEAVDALAQAIGLRRTARVVMPANNVCVVWDAQ